MLEYYVKYQAVDRRSSIKEKGSTGDSIYLKEKGSCLSKIGSSLINGYPQRKINPINKGSYLTQPRALRKV